MNVQALLEEVNRKLTYYPGTGNFMINNYYRARCPGKILVPNCNGYIYYHLQKTSVLMHRVVWLLEKGYLPEKQLDHKDGNKGNNFIGNLRECTQSENNHGFSGHTLTRSQTGQRNITPTPYGTFQVQLKFPETIVHLGSYKTLEEAIKVRDDFTNSGAIPEHCAAALLAKAEGKIPSYVLEGKLPKHRQ